MQNEIRAFTLVVQHTLPEARDVEEGHLVGAVPVVAGGEVHGLAQVTHGTLVAAGTLAAAAAAAATLLADVVLVALGHY